MKIDNLPSSVEANEEGILVLVSGHIGNFNDLSPRAIEALIAADVWLVEDTRVTGRIATKLDLRKPMKLLTDHTDDFQLSKYVSLVKSGQSVVVITDGGAPGISDPGARLCDLCRIEGLNVDAIPGPSAVTMALSLSGFFAQRFVFLGFLGRKPGTIRSELEEYLDSSLTIVLFESPHRLDSFLEVAAEVLPNRRYSICRELTKPYQQVWRGTFPEIPLPEVCPRLGEFTIVIEGKRKGNL